MQMPWAASVDTKNGTESVLVMAETEADAIDAISYQFDVSADAVSMYESIAELLETQYDGFAKLTTI